MQSGIRLMEAGFVPDWAIRLGIRSICRERLKEEACDSVEQEAEALMGFIEKLKASPIAEVPEKANEQHYEVDSDFYQLVLGTHLKYSSCYYTSESSSLADAESYMLQKSCERAELADGQKILELGCGWGSLTLWMAAHYPNASITAVSNSSSQKTFIEKQCLTRGLKNVRIITADINQFSIEAGFDRIVSVEMFEHMKNYHELHRRIASWLKPGGKLFVHIFCHRKYAYPYVVEGNSNWMGQHFFSGGTMPSDALLLYFQDHLCIEKHWRVSGMHYSRTALDWYTNMLSRESEVRVALSRIYGPDKQALWFIRWKVFFLACVELFGFRGGQEWFVSHYRFVRRS